MYKCQIDHNLYADNQTRTCSPFCPNVTNITTGALLYITYADDSTKTCVAVCPDYPRTYGYNFTNRCLSQCPPPTFGDNDTRVCHDVCFFGLQAGPNNTVKYTWADPATNFCTSQCTRNSWADNATVTCTSDCTLGTFADNSTWRCVAICPVNPISFAYQLTKKCIYDCPSPLFGNEDGRLCSTTCPTSPFYYYRDYQNRRCVKSTVLFIQIARTPTSLILSHSPAPQVANSGSSQTLRCTSASSAPHPACRARLRCCALPAYLGSTATTTCVWSRALPSQSGTTVMM